MTIARAEMEQREQDRDEEDKIAEQDRQTAENMKDYWKHQNSGAEASWEES